MVSRHAAGLLAIGQNYVMHGSPRAARQWHAVLNELQLAMHNIDPSSPAIQVVLQDLKQYAATLPALFSALATANSTQRDTLADHLVEKTQRISDKAFDAISELTEQRITIERINRTVALVLQLLLLALVVAVSVFIMRRVLKPLTGLQANAYAVQNGDLSARMGNAPADEIGNLARDFDKMTMQLQARDNALQDSNASLEERVRQRTKELTKEVTERKHANDAIKESERRLAMLMENLPGTVYRCRNDPQWTMEFVSQGCEELTGYAPVDFIMNRNITFTDITAPEDRQRLFVDTQRSIAAKTPFMHEYRITTAAGAVKWVWEKGCGVYGETGDLIAIEGLITDITEHKQAQDEILRLNAGLEERVQQRTTALTEEITERKQAEARTLRFKNVLDNTLDMIFMFEPESLRFVYVNQGAVLNMGYSREELLGMTPCQIKPLIPEPEFRQLIAPLLSGEQSSLRFDTVHRRKDDTDFPVSVFLQLVTQSDGSRLFVAIVHDITEKKESEQVIWQQANFDTLTGLPNRRMFHDRLEQEIKKSHRSGLPMALILLDMDRFKEVNDTLGHAQGDVLLVEAARRIAECVRESDTVARLGGDEFTVILSEIEDTNSVERIAQNIIERLATPYQLLQETVFVSASAGITLYPNDAQNIEALLKNADQAMYLAKKSGRNRFRYFTASLQEAAQTRLRLISDLRGALVGQQFQVFYQPIVTLANGAIHKAEALLRWQHPTRGFISPAEFIPVAEETGMIIDIGDWVFREVASQAAHWRASHYPKFQISINISPVQFRHQGTNFKAWLDYLQELGLPGQNIVLEITEGLLLEADTAVTDQLLAFRDAGIRVSLDDFGTGYSSLSYLKKFDIDYLKIDQSFVRNMADNTNDRILCEAIIVMAHKLGLKVIAEGVETEQQRDLLAAYDCDYAQGWLYSKAVPPEQFEALVWGQAK